MAPAAIDRYAHRALGSKPTGRTPLLLSIDGTDGQTDGRQAVT